MIGKIANAALHQSDEALSRSRHGDSAEAALAGIVSVDVSNPAPAGGNTGTLVQFTYTPKFSGKLLIEADAAGTESAATFTTRFRINLSSGVEEFIEVGPGADTAHTLGVAFERLFTGQVIGVPITVSFFWACNGGGGNTFTPGDGQGALTLFELPQ
jgi:hypothetical protein